MDMEAENTRLLFGISLCLIGGCAWILGLCLESIWVYCSGPALLSAGFTIGIWDNQA